MKEEPNSNQKPEKTAVLPSASPDPIKKSTYLYFL